MYVCSSMGSGIATGQASPFRNTLPSPTLRSEQLCQWWERIAMYLLVLGDCAMQIIISKREQLQLTTYKFVWGGEKAAPCLYPGTSMTSRSASINSHRIATVSIDYRCADSGDRDYLKA